jgi:hypothetical protein
VITPPLSLTAIVSLSSVPPDRLDRPKIVSTAFLRYPLAPFLHWADEAPPCRLTELRRVRQTVFGNSTIAYGLGYAIGIW